MTTVSTLSTNSTTYTYEELQAALTDGTIDTDDVTDISIFSASTDSSECTDGEDDGKIGILSAAGNMVKGAVSGVVNGIKGMFTDEDGNFSLAQTAKSAAMIGACFIPGVGPIIATGLCTYGAISGAATVIQGVAAAATAETDAEAKAAFQSIGSGTLTTALSAYGLKASISSVASTAGVEGATTNSVLQNIKGIGKNISESASTASTITGKISSGFNTLTGNYYSSAWNASEATSTVGKVADVAKQTAADTGSNIIKAAETVKNKAQDTIDKVTGKKGTASDVSTINEKFSEKYGDINGEGTYTSNDGSTTLEVKKVTNANGDVTYEYSTTKNTGTVSEYSKTESPTTAKTEVSLDEISEKYKLSDAQFDDLVNNGKVTASDGTTITYDSASDTITATSTTETTAYTKETTATNTLDSLKDTKVKVSTTNADGTTTTSTVKLGDQLTETGSSVTTTDGTTYTLNADNTVTQVSTSASNKLAYDWSNYKASSVEGSYTGIASSGNVITAGLAALSTSTADASSDIADSISDASTTYATVNTQTGVEYELEDYSIMSEEEVDEIYANILSTAYSI